MYAEYFLEYIKERQTNPVGKSLARVLEDLQDPEGPLPQIRRVKQKEPVLAPRKGAVPLGVYEANLMRLLRPGHEGSCYVQMVVVQSLTHQVVVGYSCLAQWEGHPLLPGGHVLQSETPVQAAVRLLYDEVGVTALASDCKEIGVFGALTLFLYEYNSTALPPGGLDVSQSFFRLAHGMFFKWADLVNVLEPTLRFFVRTALRAVRGQSPRVAIRLQRALWKEDANRTRGTQLFWAELIKAQRSRTAALL